MTTTTYASDFYENRYAATRESAEIVADIVLSLAPVRSVIDLGCGVGTWLSVFNQRAGAEVFGTEGEWLERKHLVIPADCFANADLRQPFRHPRKFDLAMSLEVAEHLPATSAPTIVESLTELAPLVLFSAAAPGQGGVDHLNEQWPEYWAQLFAARGYDTIDAIRPRARRSGKVLWWYTQNALLFVRRDRIGEYPKLAAERHPDPAVGLSVVHPSLYEMKLRELSRLERQERDRASHRPGIGESLKQLSGSVKRSFRKRVLGAA